MKAAIYARKSTDDNDRNEDNKSVTRQAERAKAYAESRGWIVEPDHIFVDDNQSGAVFNRPALLQMLNRLPEFDVIVMSELSRLGREQWATASALANIDAKNVKVHLYLTDEELRYDSAVDKFLVQAVAFAAELEREKASQRSRDALLRKAERGYNTGGIVYGYDNVEIYNTAGTGERVRAHTEYRVNEHQAEVVRAMFQMYADGYGYTTIAKTMNGNPRCHCENRKYFSGRTPDSPRKGTGSWAPSSIRAMLRNERYTGKVPFGLHRKVYKQGIKKREKQHSPLLVDQPHLKIVPDDLWRDVQQRLQSVVKTYLHSTDGRLWGRPGMGAESKYLLTGNARCDCCGANISVLSRPSGKKRLFYYGCGYHRTRGITVCRNNHIERMEIMDTAVLDAIERTVLTPEAVDYVIDKAVKSIEQRQAAGRDHPIRLKRDIRKLRRELENLLRLAANGVHSDSLAAEITKRERQIKILEIELATHAAKTPGEIEIYRLKKTLRERMGKFKDLIYDDVPKARQALRKLLEEPLRFIPIERDGRNTYAFEGKTRVGALLAADPLFYREVASPRGFEPLLQP